MGGLCSREAVRHPSWPAGGPLSGAVGALGRYVVAWSRLCHFPDLFLTSLGSPYPTPHTAEEPQVDALCFLPCTCLLSVPKPQK